MAPGGLEACRVGETRASPVDLRAAQGGEGQATFFVDAGILTSDFPCSAGGRSPEQPASEWGGQRAQAAGPRMPAVRGPRREGSAGRAGPCPWAQAAGLGCQPSVPQLSHPSAGPAESRGCWVRDSKNSRGWARVIIRLGQSPSSGTPPLLSEPREEQGTWLGQRGCGRPT